MLFDLDGTLYDTADDLGAALNFVLKQHGKAPLSPKQYRPLVSNGSIALLKGGFHHQWERFSNSKRKALQLALFDYYQAHPNTLSLPYPGIPSLIQQLEKNQIKWGIMTNKPTHLTNALVADSPLLANAQVIVCGDTLSKAKPHPEPLLHCAKLLGVEPSRCLYIGDDERDIIAGNAATMTTCVAMWGYLDKGAVSAWNADFIANNAQELHNYILG